MAETGGSSSSGLWAREAYCIYRKLPPPPGLESPAPETVERPPPETDEDLEEHFAVLKDLLQDTTFVKKAKEVTFSFAPSSACEDEHVGGEEEESERTSMWERTKEDACEDDEKMGEEQADDPSCDDDEEMGNQRTAEDEADYQANFRKAYQENVRT